MNKIQLSEVKHLKKEVPEFSVGDTLKIQVKIVEGDKTRLQAFEGLVISRKGVGIRESFTLRRISYGEGVERTFPLHSPFVEKIEVVKRGKAKRAKLYYLRKKIGKRSKIEEKEEAKIEETSPST
ncbi:MAG: 50S ribosomal protein L19 [Candidatus Omnitrophica bacterium]|nr:50S ribosomal protein L19 [Candidatus Omnitrophota bacterium]